MDFRKLISGFLAASVALTSASAYIPEHPKEGFNSHTAAAFLINEDRSLRCQVTPEIAELFSSQDMAALAQNDALALKTGQEEKLRFCDEGDVAYARIVFLDSAVQASLPDMMLFALGALAGVGAFSIGFILRSNAARKDAVRRRSERVANGNGDGLRIMALNVLEAVCGKGGFFITGECHLYGGDSRHIWIDDDIIAVIRTIEVNCEERSAVVSEGGWMRCQAREVGKYDSPFMPTDLDAQAFLNKVKALCGEQNALLTQEGVECQVVEDEAKERKSLIAV